MRAHILTWTARVAAAAALGVATTVGIAWALGAWGDWRNSQTITTYLNPSTTNISTIRVWQVSRPGALRRVVVTYGESEWNEGMSYIPDEAWFDLRIGPDTRFDTSWGQLRDAVGIPGNRVQSVEDARGWPFYALRCWFHPNRPNAAKVQGGIPLDASENPESPTRILPCLPMWAGLAGDSGVFGAAWLVALVIPGITRAALRRRRGCCPRCGYDLQRKLAAGCPECGWNRAG